MEEKEDGDFAGGASSFKVVGFKMYASPTSVFHLY